MTSVPTVSGKLADFIHGLSFADLPASVVEIAKVRLLDCLGTALAARDLPVPAIALAFIGGNPGDAGFYRAFARSLEHVHGVPPQPDPVPCRPAESSNRPPVRRRRSRPPARR